jgi:hypothetical protein
LQVFHRDAGVDCRYMAHYTRDLSRSLDRFPTSGQRATVLWMQAKHDKAKEWLQLNYCITQEEIQREVQEWPEEWKVPQIPTMVQSARPQMQDRPAPTHQTGTNGAGTKKRNSQGQEGGSTPAKKKPCTQNRPPRGPTQAPPCTEQPPIHSTGEV